MCDSNGLGCVGLECVWFENSGVHETSNSGIGVASAREDSGQCDRREGDAEKSSTADVTNVDVSIDTLHIRLKEGVRSWIMR
jgi:hypothetical protein